MQLDIETIDELRSEIARLKSIQLEQKEALSARFDGPGAIFSTAMSLFPKNAATESLAGQDMLGLLSRFILPFALNKTVFRKSNFIVKTLVGLASQKASHFISEDAVGGLWGKAKGLFDKFTGGDKKKKPAPPKDLKGFGIPAVEQ